jgi:hypothetical protein
VSGHSPAHPHGGPTPPAARPTGESPAAEHASQAAVVGATALGLVVAPRPDGPGLLAELADGSMVVLALAREWVEASGTLPTPTQGEAVALVEEAMHLIVSPQEPSDPVA